MKHFSLFIILFSFLFAACSKEETAPQGEATTFTLAIEQDPTPVVGKAATRATITPKRYVMEVWSEGGTTAENVFENGTTNHAQITSGSSFTITLNRTKAYVCLFWADDNSTFNASQLKAVALNTGKEMNEAYFAKISVDKGKKLDVAVKLKRAVAKVVLFETDKVKTTDNLSLKFSTIYPSFSVMEGEASGKPTEWSKTIKPMADTGTIATFYFFAKEEQELTGLKFTYAADQMKNVSNIPYQQNYATSIKGEYSSIGWLQFNVSTDEVWGGTDNGVEF